MVNVEQHIIDEFNENDIESLMQKDKLGEKSFEVLKDELTRIRSLVDEIIQISLKGYSIEQPILLEVKEIITGFNNRSKNLKKYDLNQDDDYRSRQIREVHQWHNSIFKGFHEQSGRVDNTLTIRNTLKTIDLTNSSDIKAVDSRIAEVEKAKKTALEHAGQVDNLLKKVRDKVSKEIAKDYAGVFEKEAKKNETWSIVWLVIALVTTLVILFYSQTIFRELLFIDMGVEEAIGLSDNKTPTINNTQIIVLNLVTRLFLISILVYIITFLFKQYSIRRHLYVTNKHKGNALNSYELFLNSMPDDQLKSTLMLEVAKSIYDVGSTGYISAKGRNDASIIELTKFMSSKGDREDK